MEKHNIRVREFLSLSNEAQFAWIEKNIPDYEIKLYGDGYLGAYYPRPIDWDEYLNNREDYGVSGLICLLYTSPSPRDKRQSRMPSSA